MDSLKLVHPFTLILAGPSGSGKSQFVKKLIENKMIKPFPKNIIWCYGVYQALYEEMPNISFHEDATSKPYGYLLIDLKPETDESLRVRTASRVARDKPWSTLCKKSHGILSSPPAAAKFRLLTGHDCLCAHLFRFNLVTSPICVLCDTGQDMTAAHLDECSALNDLNCIVKRYWRARCLMT
ncbi:uncharacterized protein TNCV_4749521 [Trichonephila clavipes]|nr:uncharacterized protein TNCV_4749521 [Trichonephila clavipes]